MRWTLFWVGRKGRRDAVGEHRRFETKFIYGKDKNDREHRAGGR